MEVKKRRASLQYRKEQQEGITYENNSTLLTVPAVQEVVIKNSTDDELETETVKCH